METTTEYRNDAKCEQNLKLKVMENRWQYEKTLLTKRKGQCNKQEEKRTKQGQPLANTHTNTMTMEPTHQHASAPNKVSPMKNTVTTFKYTDI